MMFLSDQNVVAVPDLSFSLAKLLGDSLRYFPLCYYTKYLCFKNYFINSILENLFLLYSLYIFFFPSFLVFIIFLYTSHKRFNRFCLYQTRKTRNINEFFKNVFSFIIYNFTFWKMFYILNHLMLNIVRIIYY